MGHYEVLANLRIGFRWQLQLAELEQSFVSGTETIPAIRRKLEELWPNASKNRSWCVERAKTDARTAILCSKLAGCAGHLLEQERGRDVLIEWREDAVEGIARALQEGSLS